MTCRSLIQALSIYGIAVTLSACGVSEQKGLTRDSGDFAIRNGQVVTTPANGQNPDNPAEYVVMVVTQGTSCTGSLIGRRMVLTAAHCLNRVTHPSEIGISFGLQMSEAAAHVEDFKIHEDYEQNLPGDQNNPHDLALIELKEDAPENFRILEVPTNLIMPRQMKITATGYGSIHGRYDDKGAESGILRQTEVTMFIENQLSNLLHINQTARGICFGDSGGPAIFRYIGRYYVVGVASHIMGALTQDMMNKLIEADFDRSKVMPQYYPSFDECAGRAAYVNTKAYSNWINKNAEQLIKSPAPPALEQESSEPESL